MDTELRNTLADCIADMERGAGVEDCLKRNSSRAAELRPHLETWAAMGSLALVQPPALAFDRGRAAMLGALKPAATGFGPLSFARFAPAWATVAAVAAAVVILLGGAAGTSAALGGPDPAGRVLSVVGVNKDDGDVDDLNDGEAGNVDDAAVQDGDGCEDANRGHGNDPDHDDEDNPGQGEGNHGADGDATGDECTVVDDERVIDGEDENNGHGNDADHDDEDNPGQGQGNHGTGNNGNGQGNPGSNGNPDNPPANGISDSPPGNGNPGNPPGNGNPDNTPGNPANPPQGQGTGPKKTDAP